MGEESEQLGGILNRLGAFSVRFGLHTHELKANIDIPETILSIKA